MLRITIPPGEYWDELTQEFVSSEGQVIMMEHSLASVAKWEARWKKAFLGNEKRTRIETSDYFRCMTLTKDVDPSIFKMLQADTIEMINRYINDPMTATTFREVEQRRFSRRVLTSEVIYAWMAALQIPFECDKWHLNRLMTLIRVCSIESQPKKKQSTREIMSQNSALNAERRKRLGTTG